jgi:hypothetical protein
MNGVLARGRQPDARLLPILRDKQNWNLVFSDGAQYAGHGPNPRPMRKTSLSQLRDYANARLERCSVYEGVYFAIYGDTVEVAPPKAASVPADHLWWFAYNQDTVLLSDGETQHLTSVMDVDRNHGRIRFLDPYPDIFFLQQNQNTLGIAAKKEGENIFSVSKDEFLSVALGLVIFDTSTAITGYLSAFPAQRSNAELLLRFGYALMEAPDDRVAAEAAALFANSLEIAQRTRNGELSAMAAPMTYLAAAIGRFVAQEKNDSAMRLAMIRFLSVVLADRRFEELETHLSAGQLCRLGNSAGRANELAAALRVLDLAVAKDGDYEQARSSRAVARAYSGNPTGAAIDAECAVRLNKAAVARLQAERAAIDCRAGWLKIWKDDEIRGRTGCRSGELATLVKACCESKAFDRARAAAEELIALEPDKPVHRERLAAVNQLAAER